MPVYSKIFVTDIDQACSYEDTNAEDLFNYTWYGTKLMYEVDGIARDTKGYYTDEDGNSVAYGTPIETFPLVQEKITLNDKRICATRL